LQDVEDNSDDHTIVFLTAAKCN